MFIDVFKRKGFLPPVVCFPSCTLDHVCRLQLYVNKRIVVKPICQRQTFTFKSWYKNAEIDSESKCCHLPFFLRKISREMYKKCRKLLMFNEILENI